jgi:hypothetical protein
MVEAAPKDTRGRVSVPTRAAVKLGVPRSTLESKIRSLKINRIDSRLLRKLEGSGLPQISLKHGKHISGRQVELLQELGKSRAVVQALQ